MKDKVTKTNKETTLILRDIRVPIENYEKAAIDVALKKLALQGLPTPSSARLSKKSIDARKKESISYLCSVAVTLEGGHFDEKTLEKLSASVKKEADFSPKTGSEALSARPVIVGFGPCGMFAALALAERGYSPIVLERGGDVDERKQAVERFERERTLSTETNIQFGAGGAGTFSDGKLITRKNDERCSYVLERLVGFGAPEDILVNTRPHIGTDKLCSVVKRIAERITSLGGEIFYNTKAESFTYDSKGKGIKISSNRGEIYAGAVILAVGHSARDTYEYLYKNSFALSPKAFSVGVRIEHLAEEINYAMYGKAADKLPFAEYNLSYVTGERGTYSFCMCPGGKVVAAASEAGGVVTNGMSYHARDGKNSNSALAVSVLTKDYGNSPMGGVEFQRKLERAAFLAAGSDYSAPASTVGDFLASRSGGEPTRVMPTYMNGGCSLVDLSKILPSFVSEGLKVGIKNFGKKIKGFDAPYAFLTGVETRTSAPLRILRGESGESPSMPLLYPSGEGAGYAGGITSAAVDGLKTAALIIERFAPLFT